MSSHASEHRQRQIRVSSRTRSLCHGSGHSFFLFFLLGWLLWAASVQAVEFPGPVSLPQDGASLSALKVRLPGADRDYFVSGSSEGFLNLNRYNTESRSYTILHRFFVGGEVMTITPWLGLPVQEIGLVVGLANPDRLVFVQVNDIYPFLEIAHEVALEEDPGGVAFVGNALTGPWELGVALPGTDRVVFLAESDGQWNVSSTIDGGDQPASLVGIDLDGDAIRELVVANAGPLSGTLGIFRRQPDASYLLETVTLPEAPGLVAAHDLDGDGRDELAVALSGEPQVVFYSESAGVLGEVDRVDLTLTASAMHLRTLPDGTPGLFTSSFERGLLEFASLSDGQWARVDTYYPGCRPHDFAFADLDGDSLEDLVTVGGDTELLTGMLGNGQPGFWGFPALSLDTTPGSFVSRDLDGDGNEDLLIADAEGTTMTLFQGTPTGALSLSGLTWDLGFISGRILAENMDADPALELVALDFIAAEVVVMDFDLATGFTVLSRTPSGDFPFFVAAGDLDADLNLDLLVLTQESLGVTVMLGNGDGTLNLGTSFGFDNPADWIVPMDLNGDGLLDVAATDGLNRVWTKTNQGAGEFGEQSFVNAGAGALQMATGDLDGDGDDDVVVANRAEQSLSFFENGGAGVLIRRIGSHALPDQPAGLLLADFDLDGRQDVLVNLQVAGRLGLVFGVAEWSYAQAAEIQGGPEISGIGVVDFNLDGVPDILALDRSLLLGLTLLNVDPQEVAVAPTALEAECQGEQMLLRVEPDRPGPWSLEMGRGGQWQQVMVNGNAELGTVEFEAGTWLLQLAASEISRWGSPTDGPLMARLTVGSGADRETETWTLASGCGQAGAELMPRLAWQAEPWPNPFNPAVQARFSLGRSGVVKVGVYNLAGRHVRTLAEGQYPAGEHLVRWDGRDAAGPVSAGIYFLRIEADGGVLSRKLMLIK